VSGAMSAAVHAEALQLHGWFNADPFGRRLVSGEVSRDEYVAFLVQTYHYVRWTRPLMVSGARNAGAGRDELRRLFAQKAAEEAGHERWVLSDLHALGVPEEEVREAPPCAAVRVYLSWNRWVAGSGPPVALLGTAYVLESTSAAFADLIAGGLVERSSIPGVETAVRFLRGHGAADPGHERELAALLDRVALEEEREMVVLSARVTVRAYQGLGLAVSG